MSQVGKYELIQRIASGGMADIFLARISHGLNSGDLVALKLIRREVSDDNQYVSMFLDEARLAILLDHSSIVKTFEYGNEELQYFMAMEYISGCDLQTFMKQVAASGEQLSEAFVLSIISLVSKGLAYSHQLFDHDGTHLNIVHRDISPQNILLTFDGAVKLIDFGIAKRSNRESESQAGALKGKYGYMSPEQVVGGHITQSSDIFSLGVLSFELLTQERLFQGASDFSVLQKIRYAEIAKPSIVCPTLSPSVEAFLLKALQLDPVNRYESMDAMSQAIDQLLREVGYASPEEIAFQARKYLTAQFEDSRALVKRARAGEGMPKKGRGRFEATAVSRPEKFELEDTFDESSHIILEANSDFQSLSEKALSPLDFAPTEPATPLPERRVNTEKTRIFHGFRSSRQKQRELVLMMGAIVFAGVMLFGTWALLKDSISLDSKKSGLVVVTNPPKAKVLLNGTELGITPFSSRTIEPGIHELILQHQGYQDLEYTIEINEDGILQLDFSLLPKTKP